MKKLLVIAAAAIITLAAFRFAPGEGAASSPVEAEAATNTAFIEQIVKEDDSYVLTVDTIDWYQGEAAVKPFLEREADSGLDAPPDDYYIINDETDLKELPIASDAEVLMQIYNRTGNVLEADIVWDEPISLDQFAELLQIEDDALNIKWFPYHLTIEDGVVVKIVQQYIP